MIRHWPGLVMVACVVGVIYQLIVIAVYPEVTFILPEPQVAHAYSMHDAFDLQTTFGELGVDTSQTTHESHYHVKYECPRWKTVTVETHDSVRDWKRWLHSMGFATNH